MARTHDYAARLVWDGNTGEGTASYTAYRREYHLEIAGKPDLEGTADPLFRGDPAKHNPEELFLASVAACHMLFFLSLSARSGVRVLDYRDEVQGTMHVDANGGGRFEEVRLNPVVTIADPAQAALTAALHDEAHQRCFIANSCSVPIRHFPTVRGAAQE